MTGPGHDLRYAFRQMRRNPAFTVAAALTRALGALGASRSGVGGGIVGHGPRLAAPGDPLTIVLVSSGVAALVVGAALVPARRAAGTNVMSVLRSE